MFDTYVDTYVPIFYHLDGNYELPWCSTRWSFYPTQPPNNYIPHSFLNGDNQNWGGTYFTSGSYESDILAQMALTTDVTIDVDAVLFGDALSSTGTVCVEAGGTAKSMRIYTIQVLDHYPSLDHHPTHGRDYYRNSFRQVYTEDVTVDPDTCVQVGHTFTVEQDDLDMPESIGVIVFAQEPLNSGPAEIFQTGTMFPPHSGVFRDGFESGDLSGWSSSQP